MSVTRTPRLRRRTALGAGAILVCGTLIGLWSSLTQQPVKAAVRVGNVCTIYGQHEHKLIGVGLVVGLKGTGDGGKFPPMYKPLAATLGLLNNPVDRPTDLKDVNNTALVFVEATIPATGIRKGQKIDCFVNSLGAAKSLRGGRLLLTALGRDVIADDRVMGMASGAVYVEDASVPTSGRVPMGVSMTEDIVNLFLQNNRFQLLLDPSHASFGAAQDIVNAINSETALENSRFVVARAEGPNLISVLVPKHYDHDPVRFVAEIMNTRVDRLTTEGYVTVNTKNGTVIISGDVEISPVLISHKNLSVAIGATEGGAAPEAAPGVGFVALNDAANQQTGNTAGTRNKLQDLLDALNQLRVPTTDVIEILKTLHRSGKLHAILITE